MNTFEYLRENAFKQVYESLKNNVTKQTLVELFKNPTFETGCIKRCSQSLIHDFCPLIADGKWEVKYSYFADENNMSYNSKAPVFFDIEVFKQWRELKSDKERYEREWRDFFQKNRDIYADSRMYDGRAQIYFNSRYNHLPDACKKSEQYQKRKKLKVDEIAIILSVYAGRNYDLLYDFEKERVHRYGTVFVLSPVADTQEKRIEIVAEYFRDKILHDYSRYLMDEYDRIMAGEWAAKVLNCSIEPKVWNRDDI